jgi:hypothetical protein
VLKRLMAAWETKLFLINLYLKWIAKIIQKIHMYEITSPLHGA